MKFFFSVKKKKKKGKLKLISKKSKELDGINAKLNKYTVKKRKSGNKRVLTEINVF